MATENPTEGIRHMNFLVKKADLWDKPFNWLLPGTDAGSAKALENL